MFSYNKNISSPVQFCCGYSRATQAKSPNPAPWKERNRNLNPNCIFLISLWDFAQINAIPVPSVSHFRLQLLSFFKLILMELQY